MLHYGVSPQVQPSGPVQEPQRPALPLAHVLHSQLSAHWQLGPATVSKVQHAQQAIYDALGDTRISVSIVEIAFM